MDNRGYRSMVEAGHASVAMPAAFPGASPGLLMALKIAEAHAAPMARNFRLVTSDDGTAVWTHVVAATFMRACQQ
jgi:hypothetical protein